MKRIILFLLLWASLPAAAQEKLLLPDSLYFYPHLQSQLALAYENVTALSSSRIANVGMAGLFYQQEGGHLRDAQTAERVHQAALKAEGIHTLGGWKVSGKFSFERQWLDSLSWSMNSMDGNKVTPQYYAVEKGGSYESIHYRMQGVASYTLNPDKLFIGIRADYDYYESSRAIDPRYQVKEFRLLLKPELSLKLKQQQVGIGISYGYGREDIAQVRYHNDAYTGGSFPERFNYLVRGYGLVERINDAFFKPKDTWGVFGHHAAHWGNWTSNVGIEVSKQTERSMWPVNESSSGIENANFQQATIQANAQLFQTTSVGTHLLQFAYKQQDADNYDSRLKGVNYLYENQEASLQYKRFRSTNTVLQSLLGVAFYYVSERREEVQKDTYLSYQQLKPQLSVGVYKYFSKQDRLSILLEPALTIPTSVTLQAPATQSAGIAIYPGIIYPAYRYFNTGYWEIGAQTSFLSKRLVKSFSTQFKIEGIYQQIYRHSEDSYAATFRPDNHRLMINCSVQFFF